MNQTISLRIPQSHLMKLADLADQKKRGASTQDLIREAVANYIKDQAVGERLSALERRLTEKIEAESATIQSVIKALAE